MHSVWLRRDWKRDSPYWKAVSHEVEVYQFLQKGQGSVVPVFLGAIDLKMTHFLHGGGQIRHMLLMAWAGTEIPEHGNSRTVLREVRRSRKEIRALGVLPGYFGSEEALRNAELWRALIIGFIALSWLID
jgi:hypothetical protein